MNTEQYREECRLLSKMVITIFSFFCWGKKNKSSSFIDLNYQRNYGGENMEKEYNIKLPDDTLVPVTEEVHRAYKRPQWREAKQNDIKIKREVSLEKMEDVHTLADEKLVEQILENKLLIEMYSSK